MRVLLVLILLASSASLADEFVAPQPPPSDVGRYVALTSGDITLKLDSMTGSTWFSCTKKGRPGWCRAKDVAGLSAGPAGRYRLVDASPILLLDTVSGRSWSRCDLPTPEKGLGWCPMD
jgi:hypothetical protein